MSNESTPANPHAVSEAAECQQANGRRGAHKFIWQWAAGTMSDCVRCSTCGEVRENNNTSNAVISKPAPCPETNRSN